MTPRGRGHHGDALAERAFQARSARARPVHPQTVSMPLATRLFSAAYEIAEQIWMDANSPLTGVVHA